MLGHFYQAYVSVIPLYRDVLRLLGLTIDRRPKLRRNRLYTAVGLSIRRVEQELKR